MSSRWYTLAVVVLWLAAMSWLVQTKVVPRMAKGEPPGYQAILSGPAGIPEPPIGWRMSWNGRSLGWAVSTITRLPTQMTEVHSRLCFDHVSLDELLAAWSRLLGSLGGLPSVRLRVEAESVVTLDPFGRLVEFDSALRAMPGQSLVRLRAAVEGNQLAVSLRLPGGAGDVNDLKIPWSEGILNDSLSPQMRLPPLHAGQHWTVPSYSPLHAVNPRHPIEILLVRVEESQAPWVWNGRSEETWVVVYRTEEGEGPANEKNVRTRLWVRPDGTVLRQRLYALGGELTFNRMSDEDAMRLLEQMVGGQDVGVPARPGAKDADGQRTKDEGAGMKVRPGARDAEAAPRKPRT